MKPLKRGDIFADFAIINAKIYTVDKDFLREKKAKLPEAIACTEGKIIAVGTSAEIQKYVTKETEVLDLKGKIVLPGINDSHLHAPYLGCIGNFISDFRGVRKISDIQDTLRNVVKDLDEGEWVRGYGWPQHLIAECIKDPNRFPRKFDIDEVTPKNPVVLIDFSAHTMLVNSVALKLCKVNKDTSDPPSGEMERDESTGEPTGIFKEFGAQSLISVNVPRLTREEKKKSLLIALDQFKRNGITSFTDAAIGPGGEDYVFGVMSEDFVEIYQELYQAGKLNARVNILLLLGNYGELTFGDLKSNMDSFKIPKKLNKDYLNFPGIKIFADGIPPSFSAWMIDEYVGGGRGSLVISGRDDKEKRDSLIKMIKYVHYKGFQVGVHATGDAAVDAVVDGFVEALEEKPDDLRHYLIHADFIRPETCKTLAKYKCGITTQPFIKVLVSDDHNLKVGVERSNKEFPIRTMMDNNVIVGGSSDAPITPPNFLLGIQSAVLRKSISGKISGEDEVISIKEAIAMYTINGAWLDKSETKKGSIEVGKFADFCVIDQDICEMDASKIAETKVLYTIVGGKIVFKK